MRLVPPGVLRVLSWNLKDHLGDPFAVRRVIRSARADVVCLQEATRWPGSTQRLSTFARQVGLLHLVGGRRSAGAGLLVSLRTVVRQPLATRLPVDGGMTRPRGTASAVVGLQGHRPVEVTSIHLGLDALERARHVDLLLAAMSATRLQVVAGDLNERPGGPSWLRLSERVREPGDDAPPTFPAHRPRMRIDAVLTSPELGVLSYGWPDGVIEADVVAGSDHRPVLAEVALPPEGSG